jgi:hypothetical protein
MVTDPLPRDDRLKREYEASDAHAALRRPSARLLRGACRELGAALASTNRPHVRQAGAAILGLLSKFYGVRAPGLRVLGLRPREVYEFYTYELFGDYAHNTQMIRVWMRTAVLGKVTSHRGLLNTLLHEFCHHLDRQLLGYPSTPHTRGFFHRVDGLYHLALGTPVDQQIPLPWIKSGSVWRLDWRQIHALKRRRPVGAGKRPPIGEDPRGTPQDARIIRIVTCG